MKPKTTSSAKEPSARIAGFKGSAFQAFLLMEFTKIMKGPANYHPHRAAVRERALEVWPEIKKGFDPNSPAMLKERTVELSPEEQSVLLYGMTAYLRDENVVDVMPGAIFDPKNPQFGRLQVYSMADKCGFGADLRANTEAGEVPGYIPKPAAA